MSSKPPHHTAGFNERRSYPTWIPLLFLQCPPGPTPLLPHRCSLARPWDKRVNKKTKSRLLGSRLQDFFSCNQLQTKHAACSHFHVLVLLWFVLVLVVMTFAVVTSSHRLASSQLQKRAGSCSCFSKLRNWATIKTRHAKNE